MEGLRDKGDKQQAILINERHKNTTVKEIFTKLWLVQSVWSKTVTLKSGQGDGTFSTGKWKSWISFVPGGI